MGKAPCLGTNAVMCVHFLHFWFQNNGFAKKRIEFLCKGYEIYIWLCIFGYGLMNVNLQTAHFLENESPLTIEVTSKNTQLITVEAT